MDIRGLLRALAEAGPGVRGRVLDGMRAGDLEALAQAWEWQAHGGQREPSGGWRIWLLMAGRGFGKTRAGAEWVWARARSRPEARIALVGASIADAAAVMVEGESGLLATARPGETARWLPARGELRFPSGARARLFSGANPAALRGPQHHFAWCDELAKWRHPEASWDNLQLGLRLGERPRTLITTTPRAAVSGALLKRIAAMEGTVVTRGRTADNRHLPDAFRDEMEAIYGGTRLGRQELDGELIEDVEGALWPRELIEACRAPLDFARDERFLRRIVIGVDPPASAGGTCGIVACGVDADGTGYVLGDHSVGGTSPRGWAAKVVATAALWGADRVVAEKNNGGDMVESVLRSVDAALPVRLVSASKGKMERAEPVAARFEAGRAKFAGRFPELEDELAGMTAGGDYKGPGRSPDRADACIWALSALLLKTPAEPKIRTF